MSTPLIVLVIVVALVLLLIGAFVALYNGLVRKKNQVANVFANIDALLLKRYDLIPNLVSTVKVYMKHERETLEQIVALRARAMSKDLSDDEKVAVDNQFSQAFGGIMVAVENYPELKANENFRDLQRTLTEVEEQISAARRAYNAVVTTFNNALEVIPSNFVAALMGYQQKALFEISQQQRENVQVGELFAS